MRKNPINVRLLLVLVLVLVAAARAQSAPAAPQDSNRESQQHSGAHDQMPAMSSHQMEMDKRPTSFLQAIQQHSTSGTSAEPDSTPMPMLMTMKGRWMLMFHGEAFLNAVQQSGPRGEDKIFSTNWFMPMAQTQLGPGKFTARVMLSFEPATVSHRYYPELFQQGETAFGKSIIDGQHPHDFVMELAALYDLKIGEQSLLSFYFAPV